MLDLSAGQFEEAAMLGLGRAILWAQQPGTSPDQNVLRHIMLHNTAYDPQVEGARGWYASQLIKTSGNEGSFLDELERELLKQPPNDDWDEWHRLSIVGYFAGEGNAAMRRLLYERTASNIAAGYDVGVSRIVDLDGAEGIDFVVEQFARANRDAKDTYSILDVAIDEDDALRDLPIIRKLKQESGASQGHRRRHSVPIRSYQEFQERIASETGGKLLMLGRQWGLNASDEELRQAAVDMLAISQDNPRRLVAYLSIFSKRSFPLDPSPLIEMARHYCDELPWGPEGMIPDLMMPLRAFFALEQVSHPAVRAFALEQIQQNPGMAIDLFENNYQPGDWTMISEVARRHHPQETLHGIGMGIRKIFSKHPDEGALPALAFLVEHGSCSMCRLDFMEAMQRLDSLPPLMQAEAHFDAQDDAREWADNGFKLSQ
jgi:hypothetical protein